MTSFAIARVPLEPNDRGELVMRLRAPGIIRHFSFALIKRRIVLDGAPQFDEKLLAFVEADPEGDMIQRAFVVLPPEVRFSPRAGYHFEYVGAAISVHSGAQLFVYEVKAVS